MNTVVYTPLRVRAREDAGFSSDAFHIIQPDLGGGVEPTTEYLVKSTEM